MTIEWTFLEVPVGLLAAVAQPVGVKPQPSEDLFSFLERRSIDYPSIRAFYPPLQEQGIVTKQLFAELTSEDVLELGAQTVGERKALAALIAEVKLSLTGPTSPSHNALLLPAATNNSCPASPQDWVLVIRKRMAATVVIMAIGVALVIVAASLSPTLNYNTCQLETAVGDGECVVWFWVLVGGAVLGGAGLIALLAILFRCARNNDQPHYQVVSQHIQSQPPYQAKSVSVSQHANLQMSLDCFALP